VPGIPGGKKAKGKAAGKPRAKQGRSGNPAKRAEQAAAAGQPLVDPATLELPPQFKDLLKGEG
jgi:hypothetical protein